MPFEPKKITREHVLKAVELIKLENKSLIPSTLYDVIIQDAAYPPKEIMRYAHEVMNGEHNWKYQGGEPTNKFLSEMGFAIVNKPSKENDPVRDLIKKYKELIKVTHFEGEIYKWELTKRFHNRPDTNSIDFNKEFLEIDYSNLIYQMGVAVGRHIAKERPEEFRKAFKELFDESIDITIRANRFDKDVLGIYREFVPEEKFGTYQEERTIATYLAFYDSNKYPFFKDSFYQKYCKLIGIKPEGKGKKYSHYIDLLNEFIEDYILQDAELLELKSMYLPGDFYLDDQHYILAQDIFYRMLDRTIEGERKYWRVGTSDNKGNYWNIMLKNEYVSIGWSDLGDLSDGKIKSQNDISVLLTSKGNYLNNKSVLTRKSGEILNFYSKMNTGDVVLAQDGSKVLAIGYITGDYCYDNSEVFPHYRPVDWKVINPKDFYNKDGNQTTVHPLVNLELINKIKSFLQFKDETANLIPMPKNIILYGPPGTGKTYNTVNKALEIIGENIEGKTRKVIKELFDKKMQEGQIVFTTFHQSMSYEDFIEGLKPLKPEIGGESVKYDIVPGIFKKLCRKAETPTNVSFDSAYNKLLSDLEERGEIELPTVRESIKISQSKSGEDLNIKSRSYINNITKDGLAYVSKSHRYAGIWGQYYKAIFQYLKEKYGYKEMENKDVKNHVIIIDEINRGNISQIFGELITLIEEDKRLGKDEALEVTLPYSKDKFGVPANLFIIGTMNTADRSVEALDTALRRRFSFEEMVPNPELIATEGYLKADNGFVGKIDMVLLLTTINRRIGKLLDKDHQIGHSYLMCVNNLEELKTVFQSKIIPLLQEYFFGDFGKIGLVLGKGFFDSVESVQENLFADFDDYDASEFAERPVYKLKDISKLSDQEFTEAINLLLKK